MDRKNLLIAAFIVLNLAAVCFCIFWDLIASGIGVRWVLLIAPAICVPPLICMARLIRERWTMGLLATVGLVVAAVFLIPWNERKQFIMDLHSLSPGTSIAQVEEVMKDYMSAGVVEEGYISFRWSDEGAYNADIGVVRFDDGRVTSVRFHPD